MAANFNPKNLDNQTLNLASIGATLNSILLPHQRDFCIEHGITEIPGQETLHQLLVALSKCGLVIDGQPLSGSIDSIVTSTRHAQDDLHVSTVRRLLDSIVCFFAQESNAQSKVHSAPLIELHLWLSSAEHLIHPEIRAAEYSVKTQNPDVSESSRNPSLSAGNLLLLASLLQACLFTNHTNGVFQASVQTQILSLLNTQKKSSKRLKLELTDFFEFNYPKIVEMTHSFVKACACAAYSRSKGPHRIEPFLPLELNTVRKAHFFFVEEAYQQSVFLASQLTGKKEGLFDKKDILALSLSQPKDAFNALQHGIRLFHTLAQEYMEPSSRIARIEFALDRGGFSPQNNIPWGFFKNTLNV